MITAPLVLLGALLWAQAPHQVLRHDLGPEFRVGTTLDADGDWLIASVGRRTPRGERIGPETRRHVALVFERRDGEWREAVRLDDGGRDDYGFGETVAVSGGDVFVAAPGYFGGSLATSGELLLVGASQPVHVEGPPGATYLYRRLNGCWEGQTAFRSPALDAGFSAAHRGNSRLRRCREVMPIAHEPIQLHT